MKLDTISKQCLIVATFAIALCTDLIVMESVELRKTYESYHDMHSHFIRRSCLKLLTYVGATLIPIFQIIGIIKRSAVLVAPSILAAFAVLAYFIYDVALSLKSQYYSQFYFLLYPIEVFAVAFLILYPLLTAFAEIRREGACALNQQVQNKCDFVRI